MPLSSAEAIRRLRLVEWPTVALAAIIYGSWIAAIAFADRLPLPVLIVVGGWLVAWHGSLQHETIHGHPTGLRRIDDLIGGVPLSLWLPYRSYRRSHLGHHGSRAITDPFDDPESRYLGRGRGWRGRVAHAIEAVQAPLAGRLLLGPAIMIARFLIGEVGALRRRPAQVARDWAPHLAGVVALLWWLDRCGLGLGTYVLAFVYPGAALTLLRSFAEHRAAARPGHRVAIVEQAGPLALLFLNNNLHAAHHARPRLAWYRLPAWYRAHRATLVAGNGGLVYRGYGEIARRYLLRAHDRIVHPAYAVQAG